MYSWTARGGGWSLGLYCNNISDVMFKIRIMFSTYLIILAVVLIVHLLSVALGLTLSLLSVDPVGTGRLGEAVDLSTGDTSEELLGEGVGDGLAYGCEVSTQWLENRDSMSGTYPPCAGGPRRSSWQRSQHHRQGPRGRGKRGCQSPERPGTAGSRHGARLDAMLDSGQVLLLGGRHEPQASS